ncbi:ArsR/SmtB family transcription factor [Halomarina salina]|uniref:ArsR/SmtB family transcription factor n=1 Tax=Halomarina salina TaxID=1872699 RepID=A0ABD5RRC4_9EURY|nr:winged helix-turn-helix domain-containing protein [Halomarina salina]
MADTPDPIDAFEALSDETRLAIVRTLADRRRDRPDAPALSFSALRGRVGVRDSGTFNYHLNRLRRTFVRKTAEGYELDADGMRLIDVAEDRVEPTRGDARRDSECPVCGDAKCERVHVHLRSR